MREQDMKGPRCRWRLPGRSGWFPMRIAGRKLLPKVQLARAWHNRAHRSAIGHSRTGKISITTLTAPTATPALRPAGRYHQRPARKREYGRSMGGEW